MNQKSVYFELVTQLFMGLSGSWLYLQGHTGPGLLIVAGILFAITLVSRVVSITTCITSLLARLTGPISSRIITGTR